MSPAATARTDSVAAAIDLYRSRLAEDAHDLTLALLTLAAANAKGSAGFNQPSPQDAVALHALAHWRRDAKHLFSRIKALPAGAHGRSLAERWLKALIAGLDLQRQSLSLLDPVAAADAARRARQRIVEAERLKTQVDRELG